MAAFELQVETVSDNIGEQVVNVDFENGGEQRIKKHDNPIGTITVTSPALPISSSGAQADDWATFYAARSGALDSFTYLHPVTGINYNVRFASPPSPRYAAAHCRMRATFKVLSVV